MLFTLEVLQAKHGDSFILHYGDPGKPRFVIVDGGPTGVFKDSLQKRLKQLNEHCGAGRPLPIDLLMVSHIDDDHINGILELYDDMRDAKESGTRDPLCRIATLWHNAFDDILGNDDEELRKMMQSHMASTASTALAACAQQLDQEEGQPSELIRERIAVAANVPQGQRLRDAARLFGTSVNCLTLQDAKHAKTRPLIAAPKGQLQFHEFHAGLKLCVLGPSEVRLAKLQKKWAQALRKAKQDKDANALATAYLDTSAFNLSSIVVVAEVAGKRMLLTGDARGDYVLDGLRQANLLPSDGTVHLDLLKVMHHGSNRNVEQKFFETVTADHYVISADGKYDNPDIDTLRWIADARGNHKYTIHMTNRDGQNDLGKKIDKLLANDRYEHLKQQLEFIPEGKISTKIDLLDVVTY